MLEGFLSKHRGMFGGEPFGCGRSPVSCQGLRVLHRKALCKAVGWFERWSQHRGASGQWCFETHSSQFRDKNLTFPYINQAIP